MREKVCPKEIEFFANYLHMKIEKLLLNENKFSATYVCSCLLYMDANSLEKWQKTA